MKKALKAITFFVGWVLSPFTWWNDAFVNIPLSYLIANILFYIIRLPFAYLVIGSYWLTNFLGLLFMYYGGKHLVISSRNKSRSTIIIIIFLVLYSAIMIYLDKHGKLAPLNVFFKRYYIIK